MRRHHPKAIVENLRSVEKATASGKSISDCVKQIGITEVTYYRWRNRFGCCDIDQAEWQAELESEINRLRRLVSELTLDKIILTEVMTDIVTPTHRSSFVVRAMTELGISERRACRALGQHRSTQRKIKARATGVSIR